MAAANAVLDVIEDEKLYTHVSAVSAFLLEELWKLHGKYEHIGDIRGYGYFIGIDLVKDRKTREPATDWAKVILQRMRDSFILMSLDGPYSNVLKFKPPLVFNKQNAERLIETLDKVFAEMIYNS